MVAGLLTNYLWNCPTKNQSSDNGWVAFTQKSVIFNPIIPIPLSSEIFLEGGANIVEGMAIKNITNAYVE